jgi:DnaJ family protein C protein 13
MHAMLAVRALARLSGLLDDDLATPYNESAATSLHALLTPKLSNMLRDESTRELLRNLNSNLESPQVLTQLVCNVLFSSTLAKEHCDSLMSVS